MALVLSLSLIGCSKQQMEPSSQQGASAAQEGAQLQDLPGVQSESWTYTMKVKKTETSYKADDGTVVATRSYEQPILSLVSQSGETYSGGSAERGVTEAQIAVCRTFNDATGSTGLWDVDLEAQGREVYEFRKENPENMPVVSYEMTIAQSSRRGHLLSVLASEYIYLGGAHPENGLHSWNFDLEKGAFIDLMSLTDRPDELKQMLVKEIASQINVSEVRDGYYEDWYSTLLQKTDFEVFFGSESLLLWFQEYDLGPHALGLPQFSISYGSISTFLNDYGKQLLSLPANNSAPFTLTSNGISVEPYCMLWYEKTWTENGWLISGDPDDPVPSIPQEDFEKIPTITLADDFKAQYARPQSYICKVYDEQFRLLRDQWYSNTAVLWLEPGTYYCVIPAWGPQGRYIESEVAYEETLYHCIFRLIVPEGGAKPYAPEQVDSLREARIRRLDQDYVLTDAASLAKLENWLKNAEPLPGSAGCPFGSVLTLTLADGTVISCCPAEDSCGVLFSNGVYYRYAQNNEDFWKLFGIQLFEMP